MPAVFHTITRNALYMAFWPLQTNQLLFPRHTKDLLTVSKSMHMVMTD